jgi:glycosyltransferase involved in cell wall biosynthesis
LFTKNRCGEVASEDDPEKLAESIVRLVNDDGYRQELTRNAYLLAKNNFDAGSARKKLLALINGEPVS